MASDMKDFASMLDSFVEWISERGRVMLYSFLAGAILMLVFGCSSANAYTKPAGAPEIAVPNHGVVVAIFAAQTPVGHGIGVFEQRGNDWYLCGQCALVEYPTMDGPVSAAGGALPYVASKVPELNAILAARYPATGAPSTGSAIDRVNQALSGSFALGLVNGSPVLAAK